MSDKTGIEWTDATWNPVTGCNKVSDGCKHCYAERDWHRLANNSKTPHYNGRKFTDVRTRPEILDRPLRWKRPRKIFVNSMSDLFHESVPFEFIASVFAVMGVTTRHTFQVLTKRPERMLEFFRWAMNGHEQNDFDADARISSHWPKHVPWEGYDNCGPLFPYENVWLGVTAENQEEADKRIPILLQVPAAVRYVSCEPLLGKINLNRLNGTPTDYRYMMSGCCDSLRCIHPAKIDWVIVGAESGPKARPMDNEWVRDIRNQCLDAGVPLLVKQLTGKNGRPIKNIKQFPEDLRIRQYPPGDNHATH